MKAVCSVGTSAYPTPNAFQRSSTFWDIRHWH